MSNWSVDPVETPTIWDVLNSGQTCSEIPSADISDSGTCYDAGTSAPTGIDGDSANVTDAHHRLDGRLRRRLDPCRTTATPGETDVDLSVRRANSPAPLATSTTTKPAVVSWVSQPDSGSANDVTYYPDSANSATPDITYVATSDGFTLPVSLATNDAYAPDPPSGDAEEDPSNVFVHDPELAKSVAPTSATIGAHVQYTLTSCTPAGGELYAGVTTYLLGTDLSYDSTVPATASCTGGAIAGTATPTLNGGADSGFTLSRVIEHGHARLAKHARGQLGRRRRHDHHRRDRGGRRRQRPWRHDDEHRFVYLRELRRNGHRITHRCQRRVDHRHSRTSPLRRATTLAVTRAQAATVQYTLGLSNSSATDVSAANDLVATDCLENDMTYVADSAAITMPFGSLAVGSAETDDLHPRLGQLLFDWRQRAHLDAQQRVALQRDPTFAGASGTIVFDDNSRIPRRSGHLPRRRG